MTNKWVSRLARCKSNHTALVVAATPSSECPATVVRNSESANEPRCTPPPMSPLAHQEMLLSPGAAAATACSERIPFIRKLGGALQR